MKRSQQTGRRLGPDDRVGSRDGHRSFDELQNLMAGGKELQTLSAELGGTI